MTALQDWLSFRPVDQSAIKEMVCRPLRAVLSTPDAAERTRAEGAAAGHRALLTPDQREAVIASAA